MASPATAPAQPAPGSTPAPGSAPAPGSVTAPGDAPGAGGVPDAADKAGFDPMIFGADAREHVTDEQIRDAIDRLTAYLLEQQDPGTGAWVQRFQAGTHAGGESALVCLALLESGMSYQHPRLRKGLKHLAEVEMQGVYAVALRAAVWAQLPPSFHPQMRRDGRWLLAAHDGSGRFDYTPITGGVAERYDHSVTQLGLLGLWGYDQRLGGVPDALWSRVANHFQQSQVPRIGGWQYAPVGHYPVTGSMTAAGIASMLIAVDRNPDAFDPAHRRSVARGLDWLDRHFTANRNPNGAHRWYYLYSVERAMLASGWRTLNGRDWFRDGAAAIVGELRADGSIQSSLTDSAFALLFLARGRRPVWAGHIRLDPMDAADRALATATTALSDALEREVHWASVTLDEPAHQLADLPLLILSSRGALRLDENQKRTLRRYLELGGLLICNAEGASSVTVESFKRLARELFPLHPLDPVDAGHRLRKSWQPVVLNDPRTVWSLHNGARDLVLVPNWDAATVWRHDPGGETVSWKLLANAWAAAVDRGPMPTRLAARRPAPPDAMGRNLEADPEPRPAREPPPLVIGRARYDGLWRPEPAAVDRLAGYLNQRDQLDLRVQDVDLDQLHHTRLPLVWLTGADTLRLSERQADSMLQYVRDGGVLLIETVGGRTARDADETFARNLQGQIALEAGVYARRLDRSHPVLAGVDASAPDDPRDPPRPREDRRSFRSLGLDPLPRVRFSRYTEARIGFRRDPRLRITPLGEGAVVFSDEDLSIALLDSPRWGVIGYAPDSARPIMRNLLYWAARDRE